MTLNVQSLAPASPCCKLKMTGGVSHAIIMITCIMGPLIKMMSSMRIRKIGRCNKAFKKQLYVMVKMRVRHLKMLNIVKLMKQGIRVENASVNPISMHMWLITLFIVQAQVYL